MSDTVMVGTNAEIKVQVLDADKKPVPNKEVVLNSHKVIDSIKNYGTITTGHDHSDEFKNLTDTVLTTNANGYAIFVYGVDDTVDDRGDAIDAVNVDYASSHKLTFKIADIAGKEIDYTTTIRFAAINKSALGGVVVHTDKKTATGGDDGWALSTNIGAADDRVNSATTKDRNGVDTHYIRSQQVSDDTTNHAVTFGTDWTEAFIVTQLEKDASVEPANINVPREFTFGEYETYANERKTAFATVVTEVKANKLQYATVNFGDLTLSQYSRFIVQAYIVKDPANPAANNPTQIILPTEESMISGEKVSKDFSVQIPLSNVTEGYLYVMATIESKGQVNLDKNAGFSVKSITGVRRGNTGTDLTGGINETLSNLEIEWAIDNNVNYTISSELPDGNLKTYLSNLPAYANCTFEYIMPVFPYTGNAIITVINKEKKPIAYYAVPTVNNVLVPGSTTEYTNVNRLDDTVTKMYQISEREATYINTVGEIVKTDNNVLTLDSKISGVTHVIGTIKSNNSNIKIDPTNEKIYSSVHWNPIPNAGGGGGGDKSREAGIALVGQQIVLKAQLTDVNGNPVTTSGVSVSFYDTNDDTKITITAGANTVGSKGVSVIKADTTTNALGQAELILFSGKDAEALTIYAKVDDAAAQYNLKYVLGENNTEPVTTDYVDLYWVDANLMFEPDAAFTDVIKTDITTPAVNTKDEVAINPIVGEHWLYEVKSYGYVSFTFGGKLGTLTDKTVVIDGLTIQTREGSTSKGGTVTPANGKATVTSNKAVQTIVENYLDANSVTADVKITVGGTTVTYAGSGTTTLDKKLTLTIDWKETVPTARIIIPTGLKADYHVGPIPVYVLLQDANGNPIKDTDVTLKVTGVGVASSDTGNLDETNNYPVEKTDATGIAKFYVAPDGNTGAGSVSALAATVEGMSGTYTSSINWIDLPVEDFEVNKVEYDITARKLTLTFNNDIYEGSVKNVNGDVLKNIFEVSYGGVGQYVTGAEVSGNKVVLTLEGLNDTIDDSKEFMVTIHSKSSDVIRDKDTTIAQIEYRLVSVDAQELTNDTYTFKADETVPTPQ